MSLNVVAFAGTVLGARAAAVVGAGAGAGAEVDAVLLGAEGAVAVEAATPVGAVAEELTGVGDPPHPAIASDTPAARQRFIRIGFSRGVIAAY
jgi:hypothetical protein